jgi:Fic family protein
MRRIYIHDLREWPRFEWDRERLAEPLAALRLRQGRLIGHMEALGFRLQAEAVLETLTSDVLKSSEIEGERLDLQQVRSSIARKLGAHKLGVDIGALKPADRGAEGVVEMMLDATQHYDRPLTRSRLFGWQAALFPTGRSGLRKVRTGRWRADSSGPMQVVSRPMHREKVHFEAPGAARVPGEMKAFLKWFNARPQGDAVWKAALAHLWFVTLHPFDDGNGRIARAIADLALARSEASPQRFYSMSAQIRRELNAYYEILEQTQRGGMDITPWMEWFLACLGRAIDSARTSLRGVLVKARFWETFAMTPLNDRERKAVNRMLDGFEGTLSTSKYAKLTGCSQDTALRDILDLVQRGILTRGDAGGRSTSYELVQLAA